MSRRSPGALAREAVVLLACGLATLTLFALLTYRAGGPEWPHAVVNVSAWVLVVVATTMLLIASVGKASELIWRHLAR